MVLDADELARRSMIGFAETVAALGATGVGGAAVLRRPDAIGAVVPWAADNHWLDAAVVPPGAAATAGTPGLPHCLWSLPGAVTGGMPLLGVDMPCMALMLDALRDGARADVHAPPLDVVGAVNDRAYGQIDQLGPLVAALDDRRLATHGVRAGGDWACVALTLRVGDDVSVQYVATEAAHRRQGLASGLLRAVLTAARTDGATTATLQASPDGLPVYQRLGFATVATLRATVA